jgi:Tfp pilus assembly protein PilF
MERHVVTLVLLLAASAILAGCGGSTIALTYRNEETAWKQARDKAKQAFAAKDFATAETNFKEALVHARHVETQNPHHLAETLCDLADTYKMQHKNNDARATYQEAIDIGRRTEPDNKGSELFLRMSRYNQAHSWLEIGNICIEEKNYKEGLKIDAYRSGMAATVAELKRAYANVLDLQGKEPEHAKRLREEASGVTDDILEGL